MLTYVHLHRLFPWPLECAEAMCSLRGVTVAVKLALAGNREQGTGFGRNWLWQGRIDVEQGCAFVSVAIDQAAAKWEDAWEGPQLPPDPSNPSSISAFDYMVPPPF
eukprot:scaffold48564_cov19-Tisochrysis_lutea.AAC.1